jgi:sn1-specific diacylglycerol lipase
MFNYIQNNNEFRCAEVGLLHIYFIGFLVIMSLILLIQFCIVIISTRGTITNAGPRRNMVKYLYVRCLLFLIEIVWSIIGIIWLTKIKWITCSKLVYFSVLANILLCGCVLFFLLIVLFIVFDPISHLPNEDVATKRNALFDYLKKVFCCCYCCLYTGNSRKTNYENSYKQISSILEMIFRDGDLTPSDIASGIILLSQKELDQFNRESQIRKRYEKNKIKKISKSEIELIPKWMNINEAAYYIRYALATYTWPYYLYMHNVRGFCDLCCSMNASSNFCCCCCCCCCNKQGCTKKEESDDMSTVHGVDATSNEYHHHLKAFKFLSKINEYDLIHASFKNELFFVPFFVLVDHFKKNIIITIRGTLSMRLYFIF